MKSDCFNSVISVLLVIITISGAIPGVASAADGDVEGDGNSTIDLTIEDISFAPGNPEPGQTVTITATVKNQGTETSGLTNLKWYNSDTSIGQEEVQALESGSSQQISLSWTTQNEETVDIRAIVDEENSVPESDENNNEKTQPLTFRKAGFPDLIIDTFTYPENPRPAEHQSIQINVKNQGTSTSDGTKLKLYIGGILEREWDLPQLAGGESILETYTWIPVLEGPVEIKAVVDEENLISESSEENNQETATINVVDNPLPDLIIEDIVPESSAPQIGNLLNITLKVKNQGTASSEAVVVKYYINGNEGQDIYVPPLLPGGDTAVVFSLTPNTEGQMEVRGLVDSGTAVYESNEANNGFTKIVNVVAILPDLTIESLSVNPEAPKPGENITFTVTIKNNGPGASHRCELQYSINGNNETSSGKIAVPALAAGETTKGIFFWVPTAEGQIEVKLMADSGAVVRENDETNNELIKTVKIAKEATSSGSSGSGSGSGSGSSSSSSSSSKSSSGGMGSGLSKEPASNVAAKELAIRNVISGYHMRYDFPENRTFIIYVEYDAKRTFKRTTTTVEVLKNKSTLVPNLPSGRIFKHVNIWIGDKGGGLPAALENGITGFKVEKKWITDNNINESRINLQWYNKSWQPLYTEKVGEDKNYVYFKAKTPGFSSFAITEYTGEEEIKDENTTQIGATIKETLKNLEGEGKAILNASAEKEDSKEKKPMGMAKILMAISLPLFMILVEYFVLKKKL